MSPRDPTAPNENSRLVGRRRARRWALLGLVGPSSRPEHGPPEFQRGPSHLPPTDQGKIQKAKPDLDVSHCGARGLEMRNADFKLETLRSGYEGADAQSHRPVKSCLALTSPLHVTPKSRRTPTASIARRPLFSSTIRSYAS